MEKETIVTIILVSLILILSGILALNRTQNQFYEFCADKEWKGTHEIDCKAMWEDNFADGKWAEKCSDSPFTTKPSCKWLCVQDCMMINKQAGDLRCVC